MDSGNAVPLGVQAFIQQLMAKRVMTDDEAKAALKNAYQRYNNGNADLDLRGAIVEANAQLKIMKMEIKSIKFEGTVYFAFVNNAADKIASMHGCKLDDWQVEFFKELIKAFGEVEGERKVRRSELEVLRPSKGNSAKVGIDAFIDHLCEEKWLKANKARSEFELGVRTYMELPDVVATHGIPVPQFLYQ